MDEDRIRSALSSWQPPAPSADAVARIVAAAAQAPAAAPTTTAWWPPSRRWALPGAALAAALVGWLVFATPLATPVNLDDPALQTSVSDSLFSPLPDEEML
jgi:hypothetical protein